MASDTTSPDEATDATDPVTQLIRDSHTTDLTSAERRSLARSRKVAFCVLAACAVLAIGGAVYFWYLWFLTAKTCIDTYILKTADSIIIHPELASSWQSYLIGLDISSFSALTLGPAVYASGVCGEQEHDPVFPARWLVVLRARLPQCSLHGRLRDALHSFRPAGYAAELPAGGRGTTVKCVGHSLHGQPPKPGGQGRRRRSRNRRENPAICCRIRM